MDDKIRAYYDKRKSCYKDKELEGMLVERCRYLNSIFEVTQEQLDKLCKINAKLQESTEQVLGERKLNCVRCDFRGDSPETFRLLSGDIAPQS